MTNTGDIQETVLDPIKKDVDSIEEAEAEQSSKNPKLFATITDAVVEYVIRDSLAYYKDEHVEMALEYLRACETCTTTAKLIDLTTNLMVIAPPHNEQYGSLKAFLLTYFISTVGLFKQHELRDQQDDNNTLADFLEDKLKKEYPEENHPLLNANEGELLPIIKTVTEEKNKIKSGLFHSDKGKKRLSRVSALCEILKLDERNYKVIVTFFNYYAGDFEEASSKGLLLHKMQADLQFIDKNDYPVPDKGVRHNAKWHNSEIYRKKSYRAL